MGITSPFLVTSLPFLSLFLFFLGWSEGEVWVGRGVRGRGWMATSRVDPLHVTLVAQGDWYPSYIGVP